MRLPAAAERGTRTVNSTPGWSGTIELSQLSQSNARARGGKVLLGGKHRPQRGMSFSRCYRPRRTSGSRRRPPVSVHGRPTVGEHVTRTLPSAGKSRASFTAAEGLG